MASSSARPSGLRRYRARTARKASNSSTASACIVIPISLLDHFARTLCDAIVPQFSPAHPLSPADVISSPQRAAHHFADVIREHIVIFGLPLGVAHNPL